MDEWYAMSQDRKPSYEYSLNLLTLPEVIAKVRFSRSTIFEWMRQGAFPKRIQFGTRSIRWREEDICLWIEMHQTSQTASRTN